MKDQFSQGIQVPCLMSLLKSNYISVFASVSFSFFNSLSLALTFINKHYRRIGGVSGSDCVYMQ